MGDGAALAELLRHPERYKGPKGDKGDSIKGDKGDRGSDGIGPDEKVKIDADDKAGFLADKLEAGPNTSIEKHGGKLVISSAGGTVRMGGGGARLSDTTPLIEAGAGDAGDGTKASRDDHVHPEAGSSGPVEASAVSLDPEVLGQDNVQTGLEAAEAALGIILPLLLPDDGVAGQALIKQSADPGDAAWEDLTLVQSGAPTLGVDAVLLIETDGPVSSGTYKLSFASVTTAAIDGTTDDADAIAAAMNAAYGSTIAVAEGDGAAVPNDEATVRFIGDLGAQPVSVSLVDDTTDGGISLDDDIDGVLPVPVGRVGQFLIDTAVPAAYQFIASSPSWQRVWPLLGLSSDSGAFTLTLGGVFPTLEQNTQTATGENAFNRTYATSTGVGSFDAENALIATATGAGADARNLLSAESLVGGVNTIIATGGDASLNTFLNDRSDREVLRLENISGVTQRAALYVSDTDPTGVITPFGAGSVCLTTDGHAYLATGPTSADWLELGGGGPTEVEIDFGTTPVFSKTFTITDAAVSGASMIVVNPSGNVATDRVGNDLEWDNLLLGGLAGTGDFLLTALALPGPIVGKRKVYYQVS